MGETKLIDREFVRNLGKGIQRSADESLPQASRLASQAADSMQSAGQSGGIAVAAAFLFACEYTANAWARKQEDAETVNDAAQRIADNWQATEDYYGKAPTRAME